MNKMSDEYNLIVPDGIYYQQVADTIKTIGGVAEVEFVEKYANKYNLRVIYSKDCSSKFVANIVRENVLKALREILDVKLYE